MLMGTTLGMAVSVAKTKSMARNGKEILRPRIITNNQITEQIIAFKAISVSGEADPEN